MLEIINLDSARINRLAPSGRRLRSPLALVLGGAAVVAIASAAAIASSGDAVATVEAAAPVIQPVRYLGAPAGSPAEPAASSSDANSEVHRFTGQVGPDLTQALRLAGVPEARGREFVAILARAIALADGLSIEDRFDLVIERTDDVEVGRLLFIGLDRVARADVALLKWTDGKSVIWVNADGVGGERSAAMRLPVEGAISSRFGNRFHPILGHKRFHKGVDVRAIAGTPIVAAADGQVVAAGWHGGYGRQVAITHADGVRTTYSHMSRMTAVPGDPVRSGEVIGYVGSSGLSTGPHLHFEVHRNGQAVNPTSVKLDSGPAQLEGEKLHAFHNELRRVLQAPARS